MDVWDVGRVVPSSSRIVSAKRGQTNGGYRWTVQDDVFEICPIHRLVRTYGQVVDGVLLTCCSVCQAILKRTPEARS